MTKKKDTEVDARRKPGTEDSAKRSSTKKSAARRIPVPGIGWDEVSKAAAAFEYWARVRRLKVGDANIEELKYALEFKTEISKSWTPPAMLEERYGLLVRTCAFVLQRVQRKKRMTNESEAAFEKREREHRRYQAEGLVEVVTKLEPSAKSFAARPVSKWLNDARANASPVNLALELARLAEIWPNATFESMRKAESKTRQPGS